MDETIKIQSKKLVEIETKEALSLLVVQMAHDIRSPLAALNTISNELSQLPENIRVITRRAINRINDIANNLLNKYKQCNDLLKSSISPQLIADVIDSVISEKRIQIQGRSIELVYEVNNSQQNLFANLNLIEFGRMLSNIINNAVEAIYDHGRIEIILSSNKDYIFIDIKDTGHGISEDKLAIVFQKGITTKNEGHGLGLVHAKNVIDLLKGDISIQSAINKGTIVSLKLPKSFPPNWFAATLNLPTNSNIVIIDDDNSIHEIWESRFKEYKNKYLINVLHFRHLSKLIEWHQNNSHMRSLYLCDYEFIDSTITGLDIIQKLKIISSAYLVTNRYDDKIRNQCISMGLKIIPKSFSSYIPLQVINS